MTTADFNSRVRGTAEIFGRRCTPCYIQETATHVTAMRHERRGGAS